MPFGCDKRQTQFGGTDLNSSHSGGPQGLTSLSLFGVDVATVGTFERMIWIAACGNRSLEVQVKQKPKFNIEVEDEE